MNIRARCYLYIIVDLKPALRWKQALIVDELLAEWHDEWKVKGREATFPSHFYNLGRSIQNGEKPDHTGNDYRSAWRTMNRGIKIVRNVAYGEFIGKY